MNNKQVFKFLALSLAFTFAGVLSAPAEILIDESWGVAIDTVTWNTSFRPAGSQGSGQVSLAETEDIGSGNYAAFTEGPSDWGWAQEIWTVNAFPRGNNLRCTFTTWYDPTAIYTASVAPFGSAINGPFHNKTFNSGDPGGVDDQTHGNIEAAVGGEYKGLTSEMRFNQNDSWEGRAAAGPLLSTTFHDAYSAADSTANGLMIRVFLGDLTGAMFEWSDDSGSNWTFEYDNRGAPDIGSATDPVGSATEVYIGWGTHKGQVFIDDILLENDVPSGPTATPTQTPVPTQTPIFSGLEDWNNFR
jgi:hypothetical protein